MRKSHRQLSQFRITPPSTGPRIGPSAVGIDTRAMTCPSATPRLADTRIDIISGMISPAPRPCRTRNAMSDGASHATAHKTEPSRKISSPAIQATRDPNRVAAQPANGTATASASRYPVLTHWIVDTGTSRSRPSVSSAMVVIVVSRIGAIRPMITAHATRRVAGSMVWAGDVVAVMGTPLRIICVSYFRR